AVNIGIDTANAGGTPPYTWVWNIPGNGNQLVLFGVPSDSTYSVTVTDANGCTATFSQLVPHDAHTLANVKDTAINPLCSYFKGDLIVTWSGTFAPFIVNWGTGSVSTRSNSDTI